jgi:hypothetical protein
LFIKHGAPLCASVIQQFSQCSEKLMDDKGKVPFQASCACQKARLRVFCFSLHCHFVTFLYFHASFLFQNRQLAPLPFRKKKERCAQHIDIACYN